MPTFSERSLDRLYEVHPDLVTLFMAVVEEFDCSVISGMRTDEEQQELYAKGRTVGGDIVTYKDGIVNKSKHQLGLAVDVIPYPSGYKDIEIMKRFGWFVLARAKELKKEGLIDANITWGGSWKFKDYPHFQIDE